MMEARNLRNLTIAQTPLLGDENTPLHTGPGGGFDSATPRHQVAFTPNPLVTPRQPGSLGVSATPLRTPLRDTLSINLGDQMTPREDLRDQHLNSISDKRALKAGFMSLPRPENNFELLVPDDDAGEGPIVNLSEQGASDRDEKLKRAQQEEELRVLINRRSQAVKLGLPRPIGVDVTALMGNFSLEVLDSELTRAQELVNAELVKLVHKDSVEYPLPGTRARVSEFSYDQPDDDALEAAKLAIHAELAALVGFPSANPQQLREGLLQSPESVSRTAESDLLAYDTATQSWKEAFSLSLDSRIAGYSHLLDTSRQLMTKEANKAAKAEKKLGLILGGYQQRA